MHRDIIYNVEKKKKEKEKPTLADGVPPAVCPVSRKSSFFVPARALTLKFSDFSFGNANIRIIWILRPFARRRVIEQSLFSRGAWEERRRRREGGGERSSQVFSTQRARARARPNKEILDKSRQSLCCPMVVPALFSRASVRFKRCLAFRFRLVAFVRFQSLTIRVIMPTQQQHENEETFTIPLPRLRRSPRSAN